MTPPGVHVGDVAVWRIVEGVPDPLPPELFVGPATAAFDRMRAAMPPEWFAADGRPLMSVSAFVLEAPGVTVLVDSCVGSWPTPLDPVGGHDSDFLDGLQAAGFEPEDIDVVVATHLHFDHVGGNTRRGADGGIVATFPRAQYLFGELEWRHACTASSRGIPAVSSLDYAVRPLIESRQARLIGPGHQICPEISIVSTPGHTPGHVCVRVESCGVTAAVTGDIAHSPVQLVVPEVGTVFDDDAEEAARTRAVWARRWAEDGTVLLGTHFPGTGIGRLQATGDWLRYAETASARY